MRVGNLRFARLRSEQLPIDPKRARDGTIRALGDSRNHARIDDVDEPVLLEDPKVVIEPRAADAQSLGEVLRSQGLFRKQRDDPMALAVNECAQRLEIANWRHGQNAVVH